MALTYYTRWIGYLILIVTVSATVSSFAATQNSKSTETNPALPLLNRAITFYASFDHSSANADMAVGKARPATIKGHLRFMPGRYGKAIVIGTKGSGAYLKYFIDKNVDFTRPGALSFWVAPLHWKSPKRFSKRLYLHFLNVPGATRGSLIIERMGFVKNSKHKRFDRLIIGYFNFSKLKNSSNAYRGTLNWEKNDWKLIVLNWSSEGFTTSFNGSVPRHKAFSRNLTVHDFKKAGKKAIVSIGNKNKETSLIDELTFYNRHLTAKEIKKISK